MVHQWWSLNRVFWAKVNFYHDGSYQCCLSLSGVSSCSGWTGSWGRSWCWSENQSQNSRKDLGTFCKFWFKGRKRKTEKRHDSWWNNVASLLLSFSSLVVEKQPPQVIKTQSKFSTTVRYLLGEKIAPGKPVVLKAQIINESQAKNQGSIPGWVTH